MTTGSAGMIVLAQGMRRSGTTVLFDLFMECGDFACFYEPMAWGKPSPGGGSGLHGGQDLFESVHRARAAFLAEQPEWLERHTDFLAVNRFNHGAPRDAALEFEPDLPDYCRAYLDFLCRAAPRTFLKFTRMHTKVACLKELAPTAKFIHIVRDPRRVTSSYLFGKNARNRSRYPGAEQFFTRVSKASSWSSRDFSDRILGIPGYAVSGECEDFLRILLIWKYKFERTHRDGQTAFGANYLLFRHDDLLASPRETLDRLGEFLGTGLPPRAVEWTTGKLQPPPPAYADGDPRWGLAFRRLRMEQTLGDAGFGGLL